MSNMQQNEAVDLNIEQAQIQSPFTWWGSTQLVEVVSKGPVLEHLGFSTLHTSPHPI